MRFSWFTKVQQILRIQCKKYLFALKLLLYFYLLQNDTAWKSNYQTSDVATVVLP